MKIERTVARGGSFEQAIPPLPFIIAKKPEPNQDKRMVSESLSVSIGTPRDSSEPPATLNFLMSTVSKLVGKDEDRMREISKTAVEIGRHSVAGMVQAVVRSVLFDPSRPQSMCVCKFSKSEQAWVHASKGGGWFQVENDVVLGRIVSIVDALVSSHFYNVDFDKSKVRQDVMEDMRGSCLRHGFSRVALAIEDCMELDHVDPEDVTALTSKQRSEFSDIVFGCVTRGTKKYLEFFTTAVGDAGDLL